MKKRNIQTGLGILLAGSLAVTGVAPFGSAPQQVLAAEQTIVLNDTTANGEQNVSGGAITSGSVSGDAETSKKATISLGNVPTALYEWYYKVSDASVIKVTDAGYEPYPGTEDIEGGGGTQSFSVEGLKEGTAWIYFANTRRCNDDHVKYRVYKVQVNADLSVSVEQQQTKKDVTYICVEQDASTGYENQYWVKDEEVLSLQKIQYFPPASPSGSFSSSFDSGFVVYEVLGKIQGTTTVYFYEQTSDKNMDSKNIYAYEVTVEEDGTLKFKKITTQDPMITMEEPLEKRWKELDASEKQATYWCQRKVMIADETVVACVKTEIEKKFEGSGYPNLDMTSHNAEYYTLKGLKKGNTTIKISYLNQEGKVVYDYNYKVVVNSGNMQIEEITEDTTVSGEEETDKKAMISLGSTPSTLHSWYYKIADSSVIKVEDKGYKPSPGTEYMAGGGGTQSFSVEGLKEGTTWIYFANTRKENDDSWVRYRVYKVVVDKDLSVRIEEEKEKKNATYRCVIQNDSSGYENQCFVEDKAVLSVERKQYFPSDTPSDGFNLKDDNGFVIYEFLGLKEGETKVSFYEQSSNKKLESKKMFAYTVVVNEDGQVNLKDAKMKKPLITLKEPLTLIDQNKKNAGKPYKRKIIVEDKKIVTYKGKEEKNETLGDNTYTVESYTFAGKSNGSTRIKVSYLDQKGKAAYNYYYKVVVKNDNMQIEQINPFANKLAKVSKVTTKRISEKKATVSIKKVSGAVGYQVTYATDKKFTKNKKSVFTKTNKVTLKSLKKGKTYYVKVRAYRTAVGTKNYGAYSKVVKITGSGAKSL